MVYCTLTYVLYVNQGLVGLVQHGAAEDNWLISHRVNLCNVKETAVLVLQTHLCIVKYVTQELAHLVYLLA